MWQTMYKTIGTWQGTRKTRSCLHALHRRKRNFEKVFVIMSSSKRESETRRLLGDTDTCAVHWVTLCLGEYSDHSKDSFRGIRNIWKFYMTLQKIRIQGQNVSGSIFMYHQTFVWTEKENYGVISMVKKRFQLDLGKRTDLKIT